MDGLAATGSNLASPPRCASEANGWMASTAREPAALAACRVTADSAAGPHGPSAATQPLAKPTALAARSAAALSAAAHQTCSAVGASRAARAGAVAAGPRLSHQGVDAGTVHSGGVCHYPFARAKCLQRAAAYAAAPLCHAPRRWRLDRRGCHHGTSAPPPAEIAPPPAEAPSAVSTAARSATSGADTGARAILPLSAVPSAILPLGVPLGRIRPALASRPASARALGG